MTTQTKSVAGSPPADYQGPKRALVLAGGGMRVAYQAGVVKALLEDGLYFHHADGTSGGTINLGMLFSGLSPDDMCERWRTLRVKDFVSLMPLKEYLRGPGLSAMGDAEGITQMVFPHLGIDVAKIRQAQGMRGTFNVCNFSRKLNQVIPHTEIDQERLVAGVSLPIFMPAVEKDGEFYTDAVWIKDANLMEAVKQGAEEIWLVWCIGNSPTYHDGVFNQYVHMIEMSANGVLFEEFDRINDLNQRIQRGEPAYGQTKPIALHVIKPEYPLPLDPDFYLGRIDAATLITIGYSDAQQYLSSRTEMGIPFDYRATAMQTPTPGITFRETMEGWFSLGVTDPKEGARLGKTNQTTLALHASIYIRDLAQFIANPTHTGYITGSVDVESMGQQIPATRGVFNIFSPTDEPNTKLMVYEFGFVHQGQPYYLAGKKEVRDDAGFDMLSDTTTLYTTLHKGVDKTGEIVGAGILKLPLSNLVSLALSIQATNAHGLIEATKLKAQFGHFFLGQLWNAYAG